MKITITRRYAQLGGDATPAAPVEPQSPNPNPLDNGVQYDYNDTRKFVVSYYDRNGQLGDGPTWAPEDIKRNIENWVDMLLDGDITELTISSDVNGVQDMKEGTVGDSGL
jgi:hypothetical protein